jgi:hypothetical protein
MYPLNNRHIDYILNDIRARGVTIEDLQYNLLDHICCVIEQNLEENGDFENYYQQTVQSFFKKELREIEDETISLIIFKHYYTMKKAMIISGTASAAIFSTGLIFKFLHWPGASIALILGIGLLSLVFLPLMFILKIREQQNTKDKAIIGIGTLSGILISLGILFKVMHWPGANIMMQGSIVVMLLLFLPLYFFTGIRNPDTKVNTIVSSIIMLSAIGLLFTLMRSPKGTYIRDKQFTMNFIRNENLFQQELQALASSHNDSANKALSAEVTSIITQCETLKNKIVLSVTEGVSLQQLKQSDAVIGDHGFSDTFHHGAGIAAESNALKQMIAAFNKSNTLSLIDIQGMFLDDADSHYLNNINNLMALEQLLQIQRMALQSEKSLTAFHKQ